jgi:mannose/fructose/N-acetylgalactosamine-specific phosphotransferase system component IIC
MTDPMDDLDANLHERFDREYSQPLPEPFLSDTARRIAAARRRTILLRHAAQALAVATLILAAPWLIKISALVSTQLNVALDALTQWLFTPIGSAAALIIGIGGAALMRTMKTRRTY